MEIVLAILFFIGIVGFAIGTLAVAEELKKEDPEENKEQKQ